MAQDAKTRREVAQRVIELAEDPRRGEKREDSEVEVAPGVRVDPAPLTFKGAAVEVDFGEDHSLDMKLGIVDSVRDRAGLDMFSSGDLFEEGYWYGSIKDEERTGPD